MLDCKEFVDADEIAKGLSPFQPEKVSFEGYIKEQVKKGLDLTFQKLLKSKRQSNGILVFSENGVIKKVKASDLP